MLKYTLKIDGMMCGMCEAHINDCIRKTNDKAKKINSNHHKKITTFLLNEDENIDNIVLAIKELGYNVYEINKEEYKSKNLKLKRLFTKNK